MLLKLFVILCLDNFSFAQKTCGIDQSLYQGQCTQNNCVDIYIKRFQETSYQSSIVATTQMSFDIQVGYDPSRNILIKLSFLDNYVDGTTYVDNPWSCISPIHYIYTMNHARKNFEFKPTINSTYDIQTGKRYWQFTILQSTYKTTLINAMNNYTHFIYVGFYGIDFNIQNYTQITLLYSFQVAMQRYGLQHINTLFYQLLTHFNATYCQIYNPQLNCISNNGTELYFCTTSNCGNPVSSITLAQNQTFWLYVSIAAPFYQNYLLVRPTVELFSGQLLVKVIIPDLSNVTLNIGYTIIRLYVDFAYQDINLTVSTTLSPPGQTDINMSNTVSMRMYASSNQVSCIQNSTGQCLSCTEQCTINNGSASSSCPTCVYQDVVCPNGEVYDGANCISSPSCDSNYKKRFYIDEQGVYPKNFNPQVSFYGFQNASVTISFDDVEIDGLINSDNYQSCIVAEHYVYTKNFETQAHQFYAKPYLNFYKINQQKILDIQLTYNPNKLIQFGYYGIDFNIKGTALGTLQFSYQAAYSNSTQGVVITNFNQFLTCLLCKKNSEIIKQLLAFSVLILGI
ncbi:hypothetical protein pb186bvf_000346 [Paramecium bursaria]